MALATLRTGTAPHEFVTHPLHMLMPMSPQEVDFEVRLALIALLERVAFLGVDRERVKAMVEEELKLEKEAND